MHLHKLMPSVGSAQLTVNADASLTMRSHIPCHCNLFHLYLRYRKKHRHISEQAMKRWAYQILEALVYLHAHVPPIIHRDLKCDNILVNGTSGQVKVADLGLASVVQKGLSVVGEARLDGGWVVGGREGYII